MFKLQLGWVLCIAGVGALLGLQPVQAQIVLKPNGRNAVPLRVKVQTANVTIDRQFATTDLKLTFQNETAERIEADFIYTLPPDTLVTSFAYWYGEERVEAKVVEKEEAAAIYSHITTRMRDPALIELIGKRTFRARIFPVMPNSDLKVEMTLVQTLASNPKGAVFTFPLTMEKGKTLDSLNVAVKVKKDDAIEKVTSNYGLPVTTDGDSYHLSLTGTNYRPQKDLQVNLIRKPQSLHAVLYTALSGGGDGFFALALTPDRALAQPKVKISGVTTYQVTPTQLSDVKAHHVLTLFGRYKGSGKATITLTGDSANGAQALKQVVSFGSKRVANNLATKL